MNYKKNFVTFFPECINVELIKDVGMIPYILRKYYNYDSSIVCRQNDIEYTYKTKYLDDIPIDFIEKKYKNSILNIFRYLRKKSKKIDILNVYHLGIKEALLYASIYKFFNRNGYVYLKLDIDLKWIEYLKKCNKIKTFSIKKMLKKVDMISAETVQTCVEMSNMLGRKIDYIPNGFYNFDFDENDYEKENIILTVGRLGTEQKNTELLVKAFDSINNKNWNLSLVGTYTDEFKKWLNTNCKSSNVHLVGNISDRKKLSEMYKKAKIFVLPSRWESFGLVLLEALSMGCYVICSDAVPAAPDIIDSNSGEIFASENIQQLEMALEKRMKDSNQTVIWKKESDFSWINICKKIDYILISNVR